MVLSEVEVTERYPLHWLVYHNSHKELLALLQTKQFQEDELELKDPRGRTPLLLAVTLGHLECCEHLLDAGADINCEKDGWNAVHEATCSGNAQILSLCLARRHYKRRLLRGNAIPELLRQLSLAPDFYVEMKWEFTSWVPLVSRICPFDTYKVYKRGANVRVDTTLVGFSDNSWQRGDKTYIFKGQGQSASLTELDHQRGTLWSEPLCARAGRRPGRPSAARVQRRLAAPAALTYLDTDRICFERNKSGIWGWRQDKLERVNGNECKVLSANNVELVSRTRTEHLTSSRANRPALGVGALLALAADAAPEEDPDTEEDAPDAPAASAAPASPASPSYPLPPWQQYFDADTPVEIGRPVKMDTKVQKFKATLWLCEDYPLELREQIMPILDLMAAVTSSPHFAKLKDFVQMQLPAGFPVKIEIPLYHVLNARITFGNIFATETPVQHVSCIQEGDRQTCIVDDACFCICSHYVDAAAADDRVSCAGDDEDLLQYAIQQSLMEPGAGEDQVDVWEALRGAAPASPAPPSPPALLSSEERQLQKAIEDSLAELTLSNGRALPTEAEPEPSDDELARALALSAREHEDRDRLFRDEQNALAEAIRLSLIDK